MTTSNTIPTELTAREIAEAIGKKRSRVFELAAEQGWRYIESIGKGGRTRKYILGELPEEVRLRVVKYYGRLTVDSRQLPATENRQLATENQTPPEATSAASGCHAVQAGEVSRTSFNSPCLGGSSISKAVIKKTPIPASVLPLKGRENQNQLPAWAEQIARARADLVQAYWKAKDRQLTVDSGQLAETANRQLPTTMRQVTDKFLEIYNTGLALPVLFQTLGQISRSTLERWRKDLEESRNDYRVLAPNWGRHRTGQTVLSEPEATIFFKQVLHPNRLKISKAVDLTKALLAMQDIPSPSSPATFRRIAARFKSQYFDVWTLCREGEKALFDKVIPYMTRDDSLLEVGDVLVADGHRCNFFVHNPFTGKRCRPILVGFYDWKSRDLVGYAYSLNEDTQVIAAALYNAIRRLGKLPRIVLTDNGKAFKSRVFHGERDVPSGVKNQRDVGASVKELDLEQAGIGGMFGRLGIQTIFAMPYNARSKPIERFFLEFGESFERYLPAYSGSNIQDKPAYLMRNEKMMKEFFESEIFTLPQAVQALEQWLGLYRVSPHPTVEGKRKIDVFESGRGPGVDDAQLRYLMMAKEIKRIDRNGVKFLGSDYHHEILYGMREPVMIRYEFTDVTRIHIYRRSGEFLCTAERREAFHPMARIMGDAKDMSQVKEGIRQQRSLKRGTMKIAEKIIQSGINKDLLNQIPYGLLPASVPLDIERMEGEIEADKQLTVDSGQGPVDSNCQLPTVNCRPPTAEIIPIFDSAVEKYYYLSRLTRALTPEEQADLEELERCKEVKELKAYG